MDLSIKTRAPEDYEALGAHAFDEGLGEKDHGLPLASPERKHWQYGWHMQRVLREQAGQLAECSP